MKVWEQWKQKAEAAEKRLAEETQAQDEALALSFKQIETAEADLAALRETDAEIMRDSERKTREIEALKARLAAVVAIHKPFGIYDECGHDHQPGDPDTFEIEDVGVVCAAGLLYTICEACHTREGEPIEDVDALSYPCPTLRAAEGK
jgi:hypothetical protein